MSLGKLAVFTCLILALAAPSATAQIVAPVTENFDAGGTGGFELAGWVTTATDPPVIWDTDALPTPVGPGPGGAFFNGVASLNYNDDVDYEGAVAAGSVGLATSPAIDVVGLAGSVIIRFACNYQVESATAPFDFRRVRILNGATDALLGSVLFNPEVGAACGAMGAWHIHLINASAVVGALPTIKVWFEFDSDTINTFDGWFVDELSVTCADAVLPSTPVNSIPLPAAIVPSPPGVFLDWTDSTDATACGVGSILDYTVQVDDDPAFLSINFTAVVTTSNATTAVLPAGTYNWRVRARDAFGNIGAFSIPTTFVVEPPIAPSPPDTLFVNERQDGAQNGDSGFVDPLIDENPVFSAIYRDLNTTDFAVSVRYQVSLDPLFLTTLLDATVLLSPNLAKDTRCIDLPCTFQLNRDTVYFWRCLMTDVGGLPSLFSSAQSFRVGDDFEFGVRPGSSNHSRRCFVATAAWGGVSPEVARLVEFRSNVLEEAGAGRAFSRLYAGSAPKAASGAPASVARFVLTPISAAAGTPSTTGIFAALVLLALLGSAIRRI